MTTTTIPLRAARDRLIESLRIGTPYPLRDLALKYAARVVHGKPAEIHILEAQAGVAYRLCDEDGNPVAGVRDGLRSAGQVTLKTPKIVKDVTYLILAERLEPGRSAPLENYLSTPVVIKLEIRTDLEVVLQPGGSRQVDGHTLTIDYDATITATVGDSQEGISYGLEDLQGKRLSEVKVGDKSTIDLVSFGFDEDTQVSIRAYRTSGRANSVRLQAELSVRVRPNPKVGVEIHRPIVEYGGKTTLTLGSDAQASTDYELFACPLSYVAAGSSGPIEIPTEDGGTASVQEPPAIENRDHPPGFDRVGQFAAADGKRSVEVDDLREDTVFAVRAVKRDSSVALQLAWRKDNYVLVRPNPSPRVEVEKAVVMPGTPAMVTVHETQKGVAYQLHLDGDKHPVNPEGYHYEDRGVGTTRLEVDFAVETDPDPVLLLPTGPLTEKRTFSVCATKTASGVRTTLVHKVTIDVGDG